MKYVFDTGPLIDLFRHYYPSRFPSLWENFHALLSEEELISVREVYNEINSREDTLTSWAKKEKDKLFSEPTIEEFQFVSEIFQVQHFQAMIRKQKMLQGNPVADPFVIARAKVLDCQVVTTEKFRENSTKIPNICEYFSIQCINLEEFMEQEGWTF